MTVSDFNSTPNADGMITKTYTTPAGYAVNKTGTTSDCGDNFVLSPKIEFHSYFSFDTSSIPDDDIISSAVLKFRITNIYKSKRYTPSYWGQIWIWIGPNVIGANLTSAAWHNPGFNLDGIGSGYTSTGAKTYNIIDLTNVNKTGFTDVQFWNRWQSAGTKYSYIRIAQTEHGSPSYRPILTVTHAPLARTFFQGFKINNFRGFY